MTQKHFTVLNIQNAFNIFQRGEKIANFATNNIFFFYSSYYYLNKCFKFKLMFQFYFSFSFQPRILVLRDEKQHLIFAKNEFSCLIKKKERKSGQVTTGYFAAALIRTNKKHHLARFVRSREGGEGNGRVRKGCQQIKEGKGQGRVMATKGEEQDGVRSFSAAPFPPSWGKSHASRFYECLPPLAALPPIPLTRGRGLPRLAFPVVPSRIARSASLPFTPSRMSSSSSSLRSSSGRRPARLPRESVGRCFCLSCRVMPTIRSDV